LVARGFVTAQPQKRPRSSWIRFEADLANETWQADVCHWALANGDLADIVTFIDDYSRMIVGTKVVRRCTSIDVISTLKEAASRWGLPASVLTDNGAAFTSTYLGGINGFEVEMLARGIVVKHGKPFHPQTQGKIERYHRTLKAWLRRRKRAETLAELEVQLEQFCDYYNRVRPHSARGTTPREAYDSTDKASPDDNPPMLTVDTRVRRDRIDCGGKLTLRYGSKLRHLGVGRAHARKRVIKLIQGPDVRVIDASTFELLARFKINPDRNYQPALPLE
jgi:transposase InsO family protein